jgi:hypothetical protein
MPREAELVLGSTPISSSHDASSSNPPVSASTCVSDFVTFNFKCFSYKQPQQTCKSSQMSKLMQLKITRYLEKQDGEMCNDNSNVGPRLYQCHDYDNSNRLSCDPPYNAQERDCQGFPQEIQRQLCHSMVLDVQNMMKLHNAANGHRSSYGITKMGLSWLPAATSSLARFEAALLVVLSRLSIKAPIKDSDLSKTEVQDIPATICSQRKSIQ